MTPNDRDTVRAKIGRETFTGEIVDRGHDGGAVVYVEDHVGRTRAVRPDRPTHDLAEREDVIA